MRSLRTPRAKRPKYFRPAWQTQAKIDRETRRRRRVVQRAANAEPADKPQTTEN
jgi:hypothetical protein